ncbi:hypothetical protein [Cytobacillus sp. IB215665]|uniref:hypothetical protein n=1 Tax=Cytobacillus sp. IB215665 TaxID=3097357 RepID=UPI0039B78047
MNKENIRNGEFENMENKKCLKCGSTEFVEGTDYMPIKPSKMSLSGSNKIYTFCLECGEVDSIRIENTTIFKK